MITINSAENALKTVYLGAITDLLNTKVNPLLSMIEKTSVDVSGKEIRRAVRTLLDGGVGAGDEAGDLPNPVPSSYLQFVISLKNLYGQIEISDKSIRAGSEAKGAFTNLLNESLEGLLESSRFNLSRMLFGDGSGFLVNVMQNSNPTGTFNTLGVANNLTEGMLVDMYDISNPSVPAKINVRLLSIDRYGEIQRVVLDIDSDMDSTYSLFVQGSKDKEITGLGAIFNIDKPLYGLDRRVHKVLRPYIDDYMKPVSDIVFSSAIDHVEAFTSSTIDYITCAQNVKLAYQEYLSTYKRNVDIMQLAGGYKTISFNGIPIVAERFMQDSKMYFLNSKSFKMHQLCDWQFIENENGRVLRQMQGKPTFSATLVKYCDLVCEKPNGQASIAIDTNPQKK
ncbi:MAG: phage major capsid protein [Clostridiales bacterium]|jgi:hypothetical protein|nr:phage major capsid protein [Clostridiales bacterium]